MNNNCIYCIKVLLAIPETLHGHWQFGILEHDG